MDRGEVLATTTVIGLGFRARCGKDTLASYMHALMPEESRVYHFADALKAWCRVQGMMKEKDGLLLQVIGTDVFRQRVDSNIWVKCLQYQIEEDHPRVAIISDMRFPNEAEWVKSRGGLTVRLTRYLADGETEFISPDRPPDHPSEVALEGYQFHRAHGALGGDLRSLRAIARELIAYCPFPGV